MHQLTRITAFWSYIRTAVITDIIAIISTLTTRKTNIIITGVNLAASAKLSWILLYIDVIILHATSKQKHYMMWLKSWAVERHGSLTKRIIILHQGMPLLSLIGLLIDLHS